MADAKQDKLEKLWKLQRAYISQLPERLSVIHKSWSAVCKYSGEVEALRDLSRQVHNLAGSAGTFGFAQLSEQSRKLEQLLTRLSNINDLGKEELDAITHALEGIDFLVEKGPDSEQQLLPDHEAVAIEMAARERLLYVVEDDALVAKDIAAQLKHFGYEVVVFSNATQAIGGIKEYVPLAMIIDLQLPEESLEGADLAEKFRSFSDRDIPLLFISARDDWDARLAAVRSGGDAYFTKPVDFGTLLDRLDLLTCLREIESYRVLVVEDMEILAEHYVWTLREAGMQAEFITNPSELLEKVAEFKPELILMDIYMPGCSGLEAAQVLRHKAELLSIPIVYLSTESDPQQQLTAMEQGADDFLQKPISDYHLVNLVRIRIERFRKLRMYMHRDGLTGLFNHTTIKLHLESEIKRTLRQQTSLVLAMLDIDNFKAVNDNYGHPAGDNAIIGMARLLLQRFRKSDIVGRYGGDEFVVILPDTTIQSARDILEDVRKHFSEIVHTHQGEKFSCTSSIGIACTPPHMDTSSLIHTADDALLQAKRKGRNRVVIIDHL